MKQCAYSSSLQHLGNSTSLEPYALVGSTRLE